MKVSTSALKDALRQISTVVRGKSAVPICDCVLITETTVEGTDLDRYMTRSVPFITGIDDTARLCVPLNDLRKTIDTCGANEVEIVGDAKKITLRWGKTVVTLPAMGPEEFPAKPKLSQESVNFESGILNALQVCADFAAEDDMRPNLCGVHFAKDEITATNGHMMIIIPVEQDCSQIGGLIIPAQTISSCASMSEPVLIGRNFIADADTELVFRAIDAKYPNYRSVVPKNQLIKATFERTALIGALKIAAAASGLTDKGRAAKLTLSKGQAFIEGQDIDFAKHSRTEIPVETNGEIVIGFNIGYMNTALAATGESVTINMEAHNRAMVIDHQGLTILVMPQIVS